MSLYELGSDTIRRLNETTFSSIGIREREDLQRLLRESIEVISPDTLIISEEFGDWEDSRRRIDLLGLDKGANLVVIELKRTEDGGHMELQALRYAAMVSTMTFDRAVEVFESYLTRLGKELNARAQLLEFLDWDEPDENLFAQDVRIVLAAADFSKELTSAVLWLNERDLDIRCVRLRPYKDMDRILIDVTQVLPLPEAADYQIRVREKSQVERSASHASKDYARYTVICDNYPKENLNKRRAIFEVCSFLIRNGITPEEISALLPWRGSRRFIVAEGELRSPEFIRLVTQRQREIGKTFEPRRFFCEDDELFHVNGRTYAFSNQWGERTDEAMQTMIDAFGRGRLSFARS